MGACADLACGHCPLPGRCCTGFTLNSATLNREPDIAKAAEILDGLRTWDVAHQPVGPLPFRLLYRTPDRPDRSAFWRLWCTWLTRDGRCGHYAKRPELCASFQPGTDGLCVITPRSETRDVMEPQPPIGCFTCPYCNASSWDPNDLKNRYCIRCGFVDDPIDREGKLRFSPAERRARLRAETDQQIAALEAKLAEKIAVLEAVEAAVKPAAGPDE